MFTATETSVLHDPVKDTLSVEPNDPPSKNRVGDFLNICYTCADESAVQVVEMHQEIETFSTTTVSGRLYQWLGGYGVYYDVDTELHLTLHRAYSCSLKRFIHPDPLGIDGGVNVYMWASLNPVWFVDPTGLRVEIQWHEVFESGNYHSSLIITPENQSQYQNDSRFIQNDAGEFFVTVGAESQFNTLVADLNRGSDIAPHDPGFTLIIPGGFESEDAFINSILQAHENYSDNLPYDAFPSPPEDRVWYLADDDYNSNSYIAGLLQNLGFEPIPLGVNLPGWDVPVPSVNYK